MKILLGNKDILTANTLDEVLTGLSNLGISSEDTALLRPPEEKLEGNITQKLREQGVREIVTGKLSTLALAKIVKELLTAPAVDYAFNKFLATITFIDKVISEKAYNDHSEELLNVLEAGQVFEFPDDLKPTPTIEQTTKEARKISEDFVDEFI